MQLCGAVERVGRASLVESHDYKELEETASRFVTRSVGPKPIIKTKDNYAMHVQRPGLL